MPIGSAKVLVFWRDSGNQNGLIRCLAGLARFAAVQGDEGWSIIGGDARTLSSEWHSARRRIPEPLACFVMVPNVHRSLAILQRLPVGSIRAYFHGDRLLGETITAEETIAGAGLMLVLPMPITLTRLV